MNATNIIFHSIRLGDWSLIWRTLTKNLWRKSSPFLNIFFVSRFKTISIFCPIFTPLVTLSVAALPPFQASPPPPPPAIISLSFCRPPYLRSVPAAGFRGPARISCKAVITMADYLCKGKPLSAGKPPYKKRNKKCDEGWGRRIEVEPSPRYLFGCP